MVGVAQLVGESALIPESGGFHSVRIHTQVAGSIPGWGKNGKQPVDVSSSLKSIKTYPQMSIKNFYLGIE